MWWALRLHSLASVRGTPHVGFTGCTIFCLLKHLEPFPLIDNDKVHGMLLQVHELRIKSTTAAAAAAKAQLQPETANSELVKSQNQVTMLQTEANRTPTLEAELAELKLQLRSAQNLAAQQQQEAILNRGVSWGSDGGDTGGTDSNGGVASPRLLSPRPSFSVRQGAAGSRRGSGGSPLGNPRLSSSGMQVLSVLLGCSWVLSLSCLAVLGCTPTRSDGAGCYFMSVVLATVHTQRRMYHRHHHRHHHHHHHHDCHYISLKVSIAT